MYTSLLLLLLLLSDPAILDGLDLTEEERSVLIDNINRRLTPQAVKIRAGTESTKRYLPCVNLHISVLSSC